MLFYYLYLLIFLFPYVFHQNVNNPFVILKLTSNKNQNSSRQFMYFSQSSKYTISMKHFQNMTIIREESSSKRGNYVCVYMDCVCGGPKCWKFRGKIMWGKTYANNHKYIIFINFEILDINEVERDSLLLKHHTQVWKMISHACGFFYNVCCIWWRMQHNDD